ncbi:MAG: rod shape-determining protein MreD [Lachnospiraceae bacterium]|nr:rod shape-determining protein MreD [Lachnospiraceae bacterium]
MIRVLLVFVELILCFLLQSTVMPALSLAGVVPDLLLILVITVAYTRGRVAGMLTGFAAGLLTDVCFNDMVGLCALFYLCIGYIAGYSQKIYEERDYTLPLLMIAAGEFLYSFAYYVAYFLLRSRTEFGYYFVHLILPRMVYTVFAAAFLYPLFHWIHRLVVRYVEKEE